MVNDTRNNWCTVCHDTTYHRVETEGKTTCLRCGTLHVPHEARPSPPGELNERDVQTVGKKE